MSSRNRHNEIIEDEEKENGSKLDLASIFPAKGDPRRPPEWYSRALLYTAIAVFLAWFAYTSWAKISYIVLDIVIALFLSLAVEPVVEMLIRHGWRRGVAAVVSLVTLLLIIVVLLALFGNMFITQLVSMVSGLPSLYNDLVANVQQYFHFQLPQMNDLGTEILKNIKTSWITDFAGQAVNTTVSIVTSFIDILTALMVAFYISTAGPKLRRAICQWLAPHTQRKFLLGWAVVQDQISGFLFSRSILAAASATFMSIFLIIIKVPYWLPLALFCGLVSQFVPTVGTYIGGALPVLFAWGDRGIWYAIGVVLFITCYQQIENFVFSPKISQRTMNINPCVAFISVLFFGSIFGALGAFLALPITASLQVLFKVYTKRYELIDVPLMNDPETTKKSKVVQGAEALSDQMAKHVPRATKGSSSKVTFDDQIRALQRVAYNLPEEDNNNSGADDEDVPTVAIPKKKRATTTTGIKLQGLKGTDSSASAPDTDTVEDANNATSAQETSTTLASTDAGAATQSDAAQGSTSGEQDRVNSDNGKKDVTNPRRNWR